MNEETSKEFRFKGGSQILGYIKRFSATEKAIFGILAIVAGISALIMASKINNSLMVEIPTRGGDLQEGIVGLPRNINPVLAVSDVDKDIASLVYSGLTKYENGKIVPDLAKSYSVSTDGLTYTFILKSNLRFQDGKPLTAEDVAFTIGKIQDPAIGSNLRENWRDVTVKVEAPDRILFLRKSPYSPFITNTTVGILPKHIWGNLSNDQFPYSQYNLEPIGTGPYEPKEITKDSGGIPTQYSLTTWSGYYSKKPNISTITFNFFSDDEKALNALKDGSIHSLSSVYSSEAAKLSSSSDAYNILSSPLPRIFGVFFNQNQSPVLADKNVRIALNMVVDREAIVKKALNGYGSPIYNPLPLGFVSPTTGFASKPITEATFTAAQTLLEKNGWKKDPSTGIYQYQKKGAKNATILTFDIYTTDAPDLKLTAEMVRDAWNKLGAQVNVKIFEYSDLFQNVIKPRKYDALLFGEFIGKDKDLYAFWHSSERVSPGLNIALYTNSKVDKLLEDIRSTSDNASRISKYNQFAEYIESDIPAVFLYVPDFIYIVPKSIQNINLGSMVISSDRWNSENEWYMETEKVWKIFAK